MTFRKWFTKMEGCETFFGAICNYAFTVVLILVAILYGHRQGTLRERERNQAATAGAAVAQSPAPTGWDRTNVISGSIRGTLSTNGLAWNHGGDITIEFDGVGMNTETDAERKALFEAILNVVRKNLPKEQKP